MRKSWLIILGVCSLMLPLHGVCAEPADDELTSIRLKTNFNIWRVNLEKAEWLNTYPKMNWNGFDVKLPDTLDDAAKTKTLSYMTMAEAKGVDFTNVRDYLTRVAAPELYREPQDVTISTDEKGKVKFEGFAFNGQQIDYEKAFYLIRQAIRDHVEDVRLPLTVIPAKVNVSDDLKQKGIVSLISTGETNFANSPANRRVNIKVGLSKFNGALIESGKESGAGMILGPVDGSTGYLKELVIKGDKTIPEYGGGLCQVSTTVYRGVLIAGLPITERTNHSYAVTYYDPQGLDATIYPPETDMKFINDTPGYILLQTTTIRDKAFANVYGTPVDRQVDLLGPWYYAYTGTPVPKVTYDPTKPKGTKEILSGAHGGFKASWYRRISYPEPNEKEVLEHIFSNYEGRGLWTVLGGEDPKAAASENGTGE